MVINFLLAIAGLVAFPQSQPALHHLSLGHVVPASETMVLQRTGIGPDFPWLKLGVQPSTR